MPWSLRDVARLGFGATIANLRAPDRRRRLAETARLWQFEAADRLPTARLTEIFPGIEAVTTRTNMDVSHMFELPYGERSIIDAVIRWSHPMTLFEFGTYTGTTTVLMADAAPAGASVQTLDLPVTGMSAEINALIGSAIRRWAPDGTDIVQHRVSTHDLDIDEWRGKVDFVFVDAEHSYDEVVLDSELALELLSAGGIVIWDDYEAGHPGVVRALSELARREPVVHLAGSRLAVLART